MTQEEDMIATVKNLLTVSLLVCIPAVFSFAQSRVAGTVNFNGVQDKLWNLAEVRNGSTVINIDRTNVKRDIYTIKFQKDRLIGAGAANAYFAPYTLGEDRVLSIGRIASSRLTASYEMKNFTERDYFMCLEKVDRWDLHDGKLELHTYDKNGAKVVLVFS